MKKLLLISAFLLCVFDAHGAVRGQSTTAPAARTARPTSVSARSGSATNTSTASKVSARVATNQPAQSSVRARVATPGATNARAASKQSVINTGTKVTAAAQNTIVDEVCWNKFMGCMDSFCMLDNANGGRCICSDQNAEYDEILAEIQELDNQSYQMATVGVERLEMGEDADAIMAQTESVTQKITTDAMKSKRQSLDLNSWNTINVDFDADVEDIFSLSSDGNSITTKTGDALYRASTKLCNAQIPECASQSEMMELMYKQRVRSDCTAYENSLRQQRTQSAQKLASAQSAMREAALEQYRAANKYDLGQCTVEFKKCMQTTGGCGSDFTGCVTQQTTRDTLLDKTVKQKKIQGASTTIEIAAWTYDALESKKPLCMDITKQCVNVRDQVWDTFLREVAPAVKSAELMAESEMRTSCVSTIASCFQKACKEHIDPEDPDGSYDACLTHSDVFESLCEIEIAPCTAINPNIMEYVQARLASMRVDSCTREFKQCLQSEDRCGEDYTQCVGLDTNSIVNMCLADKLPGCKYTQNDEDTNIDVYTNLGDIATGIFLNIDNNMLAACQKAANAAMLRVCGSTTDCDDLTVDENIGARSLEYKICPLDNDAYTYNSNNDNIIPSINYSGCLNNISQISDANLGRNTVKIGDTDSTNANKTNYAGVISGRIDWDSLNFDNDGNLDVFNYWKIVEEKTDTDTKTTTYEQQKKDDIDAELAVLRRNVDLAIKTIESDKTVSDCMNGRTFQGRGTTPLGSNNARFPELTSQMRRIIANSAIKIAKDNYYKKYDELNTQLMQDYATVGERIAEINKQNAKDARREYARQACVNFSSASAFETTPSTDSVLKKVGLTTAAVGAGLVTGAYGIATAVAFVSYLWSDSNSTNSTSITSDGTDKQLTGSKEVSEWNYKETVTTTFDWDNMICHKCVRITNCEKTRDPWFKDKYCETWAEPTETCEDTQF